MIETTQTFCDGRFELQCKLGEGTYGDVYYVRDVRKNKNVALKRVKFHGEQTQGIPATTVREIAILKEINHKNVVALEDVIFSQSASGELQLYLIFEAMDHDLKKLIKQHGGKIPFDLIRILMFHIVQGVEHLHSNKILHRDLKPDNVLISADNTSVKICDFGLSRTIHQPLRPYSQEILTLWYRSPELCINNSSYSVGVDTWAIGCIFAELVTGTPLFICQTASELMLKIVSTIGNPPADIARMPAEMAQIMKMVPNKKETDLSQIVIGMDSDGMDLLRCLLRVNPLQRITCKEALQHPFFKPLQ